MMRKVCVITGTRADYGLLYWVMRGIQDAPDLNLQIIATGMHLSTEFGLTYREIEKDSFYIDTKIEMLLSSDTPVSIAKSMGIGMMGFADALDKLKPDILVVLGDRFEILSAVAAALIAQIPVAHIHGGETTEGAFDEAIRHSITKMSHFHFVAAIEYQRRVMQLGENPANIFCVGGLGIDNIRKLPLLERPDLERALGFKFCEKNLLITFHPVTLENKSSSEQFAELLAALAELKDTCLIFTFPNTDTGGHEIIEQLKRFVMDNTNARAFTSLGQIRYLSCIQFVDGVVGNSSSGLLEVPSFNKGTINIGERQQGRLKATSVIDCLANRSDIIASINKLYSSDFQVKLKNVTNPYGYGGASEKVVHKLRSVVLEGAIKKHFFDYNVSSNID